MVDTRAAAAEDFGKLVLRLGLAAIVLFHGIFKLRNGVAWMAQPLAAFNLPAFLAYGTYVAELVAPLLLIVGAWTRLAALVIAFDMAMAAVLVLRPQLLAIRSAGGGWAIELEALIFCAAVAITLLGSGRYAVAPSRRQRDTATTPRAIMVP
jgi:putative oxidoreductase